MSGKALWPWLGNSACDARYLGHALAKTPLLEWGRYDGTRARSLATSAASHGEVARKLVLDYLPLFEELCYIHFVGRGGNPRHQFGSRRSRTMYVRVARMLGLAMIGMAIFAVGVEAGGRPKVI